GYSPPERAGRIKRNHHGRHARPLRVLCSNYPGRAAAWSYLVSRNGRDRNRCRTAGPRCAGIRRIGLYGLRQEFMEEHKHGLYERLDPALLPPLYIAYKLDLAEAS